jgi:hypothetical protein
MSIGRLFLRLIWIVIVFVDVVIGWIGFGKVATVSHHAALARDAGRSWGCRLCRWLDTVDPGHCDNAKADPLGPLD